MNTANPTPDSNLGPVPAARALLKDLQQQFAVLGQCLPLAIGIDKQLLRGLPQLDRKLLRVALRLHTNSLRYLKAMEKATVRFDLDGHAREEVSAEHRAFAAQTLRERFKKEAERRKGQREAEEAARRQTEKLNQLAAKFARRK